MRTLTIADAGAAVVGLQQEIQRSESRYDHRLHGVLLVTQSMRCPEVAQLREDAPRRPNRLGAEQIREINRVLWATPCGAGDAGELL
jgi:hypothetical protein